MIAVWFSAGVIDLIPQLLTWLFGLATLFYILSRSK